MDKYFEKIYDLIYSPIITPYNILENAKLDNYFYVKYYKSPDGLIAEMKCIVEDEGDAVFYYHFDKDDKLSKVFIEQGDLRNIVFDRQTELKNVKNKYLKKYNSKQSIHAV